MVGLGMAKGITTEKRKLIDRSAEIYRTLL